MSDDIEEPDEPTLTWVGRAKAPDAWVGRATAPTQSSGRESYDPPQVVMVEVPRRRSNGRLILISLGIVAAFCAIGGTALVVTQALLHGPDVPPASVGGTAGAKGAVATKPPAPPGLNSPVRDGMFQFTVSRVSCGHHNVDLGLISRSAQGQYCLVTLTVTNIGKQGRGFAEGFQRAIGNDDNSYSPDTAAGLIVNGGGVTVWSTVNPGNHVTGTMVFDIPKSRSIVKLELHDSPFSTGAVITLH